MAVKWTLKGKSLIKGRYLFLEANTARGEEAAFAWPLWSGCMHGSWNCSGLSCDCHSAGIRAGASAVLVGRV